MKRHSVVVAFCVSTLLSLAVGRLESKERTDGVRHFDVVLTGGRVIDPETGLDAIRNVGIRGDTRARRPQDFRDRRALVRSPKGRP